MGFKIASKDCICAHQTIVLVIQAVSVTLVELCVLGMRLVYVDTSSLQVYGSFLDYLTL